MTDERRLYVLPFRAVVGVLLGVFVLGVLGGAVGSWFTVRRLFRLAPGGERIIERVERVTVSAEDALAAAAEELAPRVVALIDERGRVRQHAMPLTADGVLVTSGAPPRGLLRARRADGSDVPASVVRSYGEAGVVFLRAQGEFVVPDVARDTAPAPGATLAAVTASGPPQGSARVLLAAVEAVPAAGTRAHAARVGLDRIPELARQLPPSFQGAPLVGSDGRMRGVVLLEGEGAFILPGSVFDALLQDYLQHPQGTDVTVLGGLRGRVELGLGAGGSPAFAFRVSKVTGAPFAAAGLRVGDIIAQLDGKPLGSPLPLLRPLLAAARAGTTVSFGIRRGDTTLTLDLQPTVR